MEKPTEKNHAKLIDLFMDPVLDPALDPAQNSILDPVLTLFETSPPETMPR
jgi:hypothetical protein